MKTCPVCKAGAFDDAEVCYGCLHRFAPQDAFAQKAVPPAETTALPSVGASGGAVTLAGGPPAAPMQPTAVPASAQVQPQAASGVAQSTPLLAGVDADAAHTVSVPVRGADIVVRIELVEPSRERGECTETGRDSAPGGPECALLRRRRPLRATVDAERGGDARRGSPEQGPQKQQVVRARHAAISVVRDQREAEIA